MPSPKISIPISQNWQFAQLPDANPPSDTGSSPPGHSLEYNKFLPVSQFPTNIHLDLLHHGLIPDPFVGKNELDVQWVGEARWAYKALFASPPISSDNGDDNEKRKAVLAFDGLDTFATVRLNGDVILESDNMFLPKRVDVTAVLKTGDEQNELVIEFDSAYLRGWELVEKYPDHKWGCWNGDNSRLAVRKAQYHWVCYPFPFSLFVDLV